MLVGAEIKQTDFTDADHRRFKKRLGEQLRALDVVLKRPVLNEDTRHIGAELELSIVDEHGRPSPIGKELVAEAATPVITPEMGAFDIELCTPPVRVSGTPFVELRERMQTT